MSLKFDPAWRLISDDNERYWAFYNANEKEFDKILWSVAWTHANNVEPEDMHSDLLLRMSRSDFIMSFNPTKSSFGTFVTGRVYGYASHIIDKHFNAIHMNSSKADNGLRDTTKDLAQVLSSDFNSINVEEDTDVSSELRIEEDFDLSLTKEEELQEINRALLPKEVRVFNLYYKKDYNLTEISEKIGMSSNYARAALNKIKIKLQLLNGIKALPKNMLLRNRLYALIGICYPAMKAYSSEFSEGENAVLAERSKIISEMFVVKNGVYVLKTDIVEKPKSENGHVLACKRALSEHEKSIIKSMFVSANGMIKEDTSLKMKAAVGKDISVFQITGAIVGLHRWVSKGELKLRNLKAYKAFIANHRKKWATYKSSKYQTPKYQAALV
jgi:RNA polymerase sigma factor (sigma-70 family)